MDESRKTEVLILAAGFGSRLGAHLPKCLVDVGGQTILERQIRTLRQVLPQAAITVVTGFCHGMVVEHLAARNLDPVRVLFNPFFQVAGILGSAWIASQALQGECVLRLDGDVLFDTQLPQALLATQTTALALTKCRHKEKTAIMANPGAVRPVLALAEDYTGPDEWLRAELYRNGDYQKLMLLAAQRPDFTFAYYFEAFNDYVGSASVPVSVVRIDHGFEINTPADLEAAQAFLQTESAE